MQKGHIEPPDRPYGEAMLSAYFVTLYIQRLIRSFANNA
jgi:hypothetical protein